MNGKDLLEAMGHVEERYVDEAEYKKLRRRVPAGWISAAACLCILIGGAMLWLEPMGKSDCAMPESNGSNMELQDNAAENMTMATMDGVQEMETAASTVEQPSVALQIVSWNGDSITATVCDRVEDAQFLPLGQEVTVLFGERIQTNGEWRQPAEGDFPVGSQVIVIYHSYQEINGEVSIVMEAIMDADLEGE